MRYRLIVPVSQIQAWVDEFCRRLHLGHTVEVEIITRARAVAEGTVTQDAAHIYYPVTHGGSLIQFIDEIEVKPGCTMASPRFIAAHEVSHLLFSTATRNGCEANIICDTVAELLTGERTTMLLHDIEGWAIIGESDKTHA